MITANVDKMLALIFASCLLVILHVARWHSVNSLNKDVPVSGFMRSSWLLFVISTLII